MKKKFLAVLTAMFLTTSVVAPSNSFASTTDTSSTKGINEKLGVPIVVYGGNLSDTEKESVKKSLDVASEAEVEEITVRGADLVKYISDGDARSRMYSSAKITRKDAGSGLVINIVTPQNITQVTSDMYSNAMLTAGIEDAVVEVAAPKAVTGHSALVGIYKAYEVTTGEKLDTERTDVANEELSVATDLAEKSGVDDEKVSQLLTEIKKQIAEQKPATKEDVEKIVNEQLSKLEINLSDQDRQLLIDLMNKISNLDIDFSKWGSQLEDLSSTLKDKLGSISEDINSDTGFWASVKNFFQKIMDGISGIFN
ncbi:DUF1002 domain-containing protein [Viridibacillus sp. FSL R5-0477]|uniref:DUF1002 domain-containing protein n=1 Tax=Viridibacillus arenosi FSL R5-213 TaxID=1227360 RepID=W4EQL9_9BACL|nr:MULTISPECIES: DUF1002 domain-containing protein [Viridibacillus]ETT82873.1 hypothetical protein C176_13227 [Viridibacillus arenosi FSL R5-213]OMC82177.1 hypothetical protein BK130_12855 [Viridibacillus sp. FSL H8-0123]OMC86334.1 hypothetical protein BK128_12570 [Viridibacillus sp. FSL H7-0596]OMC90762.1 hypothetical protein BK137_11055 [Viridibacillus arenosi]